MNTKRSSICMFIARLCMYPVLLTLAAATASAVTITVGSGTLSYSVKTVDEECSTLPVEGSGVRSNALEEPYFISTFSSFSYTASGTTTDFGGTVVQIVGPGANGTTCPAKSYPPITFLAPSAEIVFTPSSGIVGEGSAVATPAVAGWVNPKYKIVGVDYTVPGEQSYVQYTDTTMMGTNTSTSSSFSTAVASSIEICGGAGIGSSSNGTSVCGTYSNAFTQESDTSSSFAVSQSTSFTNKWSALDGPQIDHGNDVIYVWVNPQVWYTMYPTGVAGPTPLYWNGYTYDETDDSNNMEVIPLRLTWLLNPSTIPAGLQGRLLRAWAPKNTDGTGPGLTTQDYLNIAAADPFSNPKYVVTIGSDGKTTTDDRFTQTTNGELYYEPGYNDVYNWMYTTTDTEGQGGKTTYVQSFAIEVKNSADWIADISFDWKESTTFTWIDQWNSLMTQMMSQSNTVSITGPTAPYTGPEEFNVYQDNVYGTFMVNPVPPQ
jgi:hypothetical protein